MEHNNFLIIVETNEFKKYSSGKVFGRIYCKFDEIAFPDDLWDDFPIIILEWWLQGGMRLLNQSSDLEEFLFMDGSFEMHVKSFPNGLCEITCVDGFEEKNTLYRCSLNQFLSEIGQAAEKVLEKCEKEKWESEDFLALKNAHQKFLALSS